MSDLIGKNALVCGGSEGIGFASAKALAQLGANVCLLARTESKLIDSLNQLPNNGSQTHAYIQADVSQLSEQLEQITAGKFDILINNSAGPAGGALQLASAEQLLNVFQQHLIANQLITQAVLPHMQAQQWGRIVNVISTSVKEPIAMLGVSNTIRGAVASWAKTLASELAIDGITVNNVLPGYTKTQRLQQIISGRAKTKNCSETEIEKTMLASVPAARFAHAHEVAHAVAFLCQTQSAYINGINLPVDGGRTHSL